MLYSFKISCRQFRQLVKAEASRMACSYKKKLTRPYINRAYKRLTAHDPSLDGSWGINSTWSVTKQSSDYLVTLEGARCSLADWCPKDLLIAAHEAWLNGRTVEYKSERWDISPSKSKLGQSEDWPTEEEIFAVGLPRPFNGLDEDKTKNIRHRLLRRLGRLVIITKLPVDKILSTKVDVSHAKKAFHCPINLHRAIKMLGVKIDDTVSVRDILSLDMYQETEILATALVAIRSA